MSLFRLLLTLLLCVTVPTAAWASVQDGAGCAHERAQVRAVHSGHTAAAMHQHAHADTVQLAQAADSDCHVAPEHCHDGAGKSGSGKDGGCGCGCGFGACSSASLPLLPMLVGHFAWPAGTGAFARGEQIVYTDTRTGSLLRPPIS